MINIKRGRNQSRVGKYYLIYIIMSYKFYNKEGEIVYFTASSLQEAINRVAEALGSCLERV